MGTPPVIVIGMHRSGTSMLAGMLSDLGLFLGHRVQPGHHEARLFQSLNTWLLRHEGGGWDSPESVRFLLEEPRARGVAADYLRYSLRSPRAISFLGPTRYMRLRSVLALDEPWGWKDPRSTFTLPMWLDVMPDAKVVHVLRHGVDVAESLRVRQERTVEQAASVFAARKWRYLVKGKDSGFTRGLRFADLDEGLDLWERYAAESRRHVTSLGSRACELRYEDFLSHPERHLRDLVEFCGLAVDPAAISAVAGHIDSSRAFPFTRSAPLIAAAQRHAARLEAFGYGTGGFATI